MSPLCPEHGKKYYFSSDNYIPKSSGLPHFRPLRRRVQPRRHRRGRNQHRRPAALCRRDLQEDEHTTGWQISSLHLNINSKICVDSRCFRRPSRIRCPTLTSAKSPFWDADLPQSLAGLTWPGDFFWKCNYFRRFIFFVNLYVFKTWLQWHHRFREGGIRRRTQHVGAAGLQVSLIEKFPQIEFINKKYRLPLDVVDFEVQLMKDLGVKVKNNIFQVKSIFSHKKINYFIGRPRPPPWPKRPDSEQFDLRAWLLRRLCRDRKPWPKDHPGLWRAYRVTGLLHLQWLFAKGKKDAMYLFFKNCLKKDSKLW